MVRVLQRNYQHSWKYFGDQHQFVRIRPHFWFDSSIPLMDLSYLVLYKPDTPPKPDWFDEMTLTVPNQYFVRAYLRASTDEQDAQRARGALERFAHERGIVICNYYAENESGAHLDRPELFRLLADSRPTDVLLIEDVDRLSRLTAGDWDQLKLSIRERQVRVVAVNVPTTWQHLVPMQIEFDTRIFGAINEMLLDMLAAIARRDYEQRRERQAQGITKAKESGKYRGRQVDQARYDAINRLLASGSSWSVVQKIVGCSRSTISSAVKYADEKQKNDDAA